MVSVQKVQELIDEAREEIFREERDPDFKGIVSKLQERLFNYGASLKQAARALREVQGLIRERRLKEARRQYDLATTSDWPGPHLDQTEKILQVIGASLEEIGVTEEAVAELRKKAQLAELRFSWERMAETVKKTAKEMEGFLSQLPPDVPATALGSPDPVQLVSTLKSCFVTLAS